MAEATTTISVYHPPGDSEPGDVSVTIAGELSQESAVEVIGAVFDSLTFDSLAELADFQGRLMARLSQPPADVEGQAGLPPETVGPAPEQEKKP